MHLAMEFIWRHVKLSSQTRLQNIFLVILFEGKILIMLADCQLAFRVVTTYMSHYFHPVIVGSVAYCFSNWSYAVSDIFKDMNMPLTSTCNIH